MSGGRWQQDSGDLYIAAGTNGTFFPSDGAGGTSASVVGTILEKNPDCVITHVNAHGGGPLTIRDQAGNDILVLDGAGTRNALLEFNYRARMGFQIVVASGNTATVCFIQVGQS